MKHILTNFAFSIFILLPFLSSAQLLPPTDSVELKTYLTECDRKIFYRVQVPASLKTGILTIADSLTSYLKSTASFINGASFDIEFVLSKSGKIIGLRSQTNTFQQPELLEEFIKSHAFMWKPAVQNDHNVCSHVRFTTEIKDDKLTARIIKD